MARAFAAAVSALLASGCAAYASHSHAAGSGGGAQHRAAVTLGRNGQAWTLTAKVVSVRVGATWQRYHPPVTPAAGNSVVVRGKLVLVASINGATLRLAVSHDSGRTWTVSRARLRMPAQAAYIALSPDATRWVVGLPSQASAGGASQYSYGFVNAANGALVPVTLPGSAADLGWSDSSLLSPGGPADTHLYRSPDLGRSWQDVSRAVLHFTPPAANVPPTEPVFGPVLGLASGVAIVPVERVGATGLKVALEATATGRSYRLSGAIAARGSYGGGPLTIASSSYGPDRAALVLPGTKALYIVAAGKLTTIHMAGLPASPDSVSFQDAANGIAQVTTRSCATGKSGCVASTSQYVTADGGRTWTRGQS